MTRSDKDPPTKHGLPRWIVRALALVVLAIIGVLAVRTWQAYRQPARIAAALPALPDLDGRPAELQEKMRRAHAAALDRATALGGVAELGRLFQANGFIEAADACWRLLLTEEPGNAQVVYYLADLQRVASDYEGMGTWLARTTELAPTYAPAWLHLADLQFKSGQLEEAEHGYRARLALLPGDPYARLGLARVSVQRGRREQARAEIEQLVQDAPGFPPGHNLYAEMLAAEGNEAGATAQRFLGSEARFREADDPWLEELIDRCYDYEQLCVHATTCILTGRPERGQVLVERAIALRPGLFPAYEILGNLYLDRKDAVQARETYERALQRVPDTNPPAVFYANLSRAYGLMHQPADAARVAREGLAQSGPAAELYLALGDALGALGDTEAAVEALRAAVEQNPRDASGHYKLALALLAVQRLDEAMAALHQSLAAQPAFPSTLALLAQIEINSGRWQSAVRYLQPLYDSHPELPDAREKMVLCHLRAGAEAEQSRDLAAAELHYRAGLAIERDHTDLQARLGALYLIQRRFTDAVEPLEAYHRLQPDNPQSALFLGQAYVAVGRRDEGRQILIKGAQLAEHIGNAATAQRCREILRRLP